MTFANDIQSARGGLIERITAAVSEYRAARAERAQKDRVYRDTLTELQSLSPRDLDDIGLRRADIEDIAREAAYGK